MFGDIAEWVKPILMILLAIGVYFACAHIDRRRNALARKWATTRGFSYQQSNPALLPYLCGEVFDGAVNPEVEQFIEGTTYSGRAFCSFWYTFRSSTRRENRLITNRVVAMVRLPAPLPYLSVTKEGVGDKVTRFFGGQDIELESDEFNQMFRVKSPVEAFAYAVLHPRMMEWLMGPASAAVPFVIDGQDLICWHVGLPDYDTLDRRLAYMCEFIDQIPPNVWEKYGAPPQLCWWSSPQLPSSVTSGRSTWRLKRRPEIAP